MLLDVQADILSMLNTCVVVPLLPAALAPTPARRLNPVFDVGEERLVLVTQFMAAVPASLLTHPVASLAEAHLDIVAALDFPHGEF